VSQAEQRIQNKRNKVEELIVQVSLETLGLNLNLHLNRLLSAGHAFISHSCLLVELRLSA